MTIRATDRGKLGHVTGLADGVFVSMEFQGRLLDPTGQGWERHMESGENETGTGKAKVPETGSDKRLAIDSRYSRFSAPATLLHHPQADPPPVLKVEPTRRGIGSQRPLLQGLLSPAGPSRPTVRHKRETHFA